MIAPGCGGLAIGRCRIETADWEAMAKGCNNPGSGRMKSGGGLLASSTFCRSHSSGEMDTTQGRWLANVILEGVEEVEMELSGKSSGRGHFPVHPKSTNYVRREWEDP